MPILDYVPTPQQMLALSDVFDRMPLGLDGHKVKGGQRQMTWEEFKKSVRLEIGGTAIMVPWAGMWLGIERDGHVHS